MEDNGGCSGGGVPVVEIALVRDTTAEWRLDWAAFRRNGYRVTVHPQGDKPALEEAFCQEFLDHIVEYLPGEGSKPGVLTSSVWIELPSVVLGRIRVLFTQPAGKVERMILRFQQAVGDLQSILLPKLRSVPQQPQPEALEAMASKALLDLLVPCLDLAEVEVSAMTETHYHQVLERLFTLKSTKEELNIFAHLLQRFIEHTSGLAPGTIEDRREGMDWLVPDADEANALCRLR